MEAKAIDNWQLLIAAMLLLAAGGVSLLMRLGLGKKLAVAASRTVIQLMLVGYVLKWVFALDNFYVLLGVVCVMVTVACRTAVKRPARTFTGVGRNAFFSLICSGLLVSVLVTGVVIRCDPWWQPRYLIPLMGMILGNSMTGISLCLDHLLETLAEKKALVEMELAHGASSWEAAREPVAESVKRGMIPTLNTMMVVGLVSLPGMMTGQILAGADPVQAVKYQIIVMFMISAAVAIGCIILSVLACKRLFNDRHQLRSELIIKQS